MYHIVKALSLIVVLMSLISGCGRFGGTQISIESVNYETDKATVYAECPHISFMKNKEFQEELNSSFQTELDKRLVEFDTASDSPGELSGGNKCVFEVHREIMYNDNDFISILTDSYTYLGGAHGSTEWSAQNIDVKNGYEITLDDLFEEEGYIEVLNGLIMKEIEENPDEYSDLWEIPQIKESNQKDFYFNGDGLVIFYQPYDLSYYVRGKVEFELEFEDIGTYFKDEYRRLIKE